jgi:hypothetical protein
MAFNPFHSFRKHQKYWMAGAVLVCMLTFVLCGAGMGSKGLDDLVMTYFRPKGEELVSINGRNYHYPDLTKLKENRQIANDYMRELLKTAVKTMQRYITQAKASQQEKSDENLKRQVALIELCMNDLTDKLDTPRYFRGGTKLDDLIDFILWRDLADKYGIEVNRDLLAQMIVEASHAYPNVWNFSSDASRMVQAYVANSHQNATDAVIVEALRDEFRVQIAQLAAIGRWSPGPFSPGIGFTREGYAELTVKNMGFPPPGLLLNTPMEFRITPTLEEMNAFYRQSRTELTIALLPVSLEELAKTRPLPANKLAELKDFYDRNLNNPYNPSSGKPGFRFPARAEIQMLYADAEMDFYKEAAKWMSMWQKHPILAVSPMNSPLSGPIGFLAAAPAWQTSLMRNAESERERFEKKLFSQSITRAELLKKQFAATDPTTKAEIQIALDRLNVNPNANDASPCSTPYFYSQGQFENAITKPSATTVAALAGGTSSWPAAALAGDPFSGVLTACAFMNGAAYREQAKKIEPMVSLARPKRIEIGSGIVEAHLTALNGAGPFAAAALTSYATNQPQFLPVAGYLETELQTKIEEILAQRWVNEAMLYAKRQLEGVKGRETVFADLVRDLTRKGVTLAGKDGKKIFAPLYRFAQTDELLTEYEVDFDDALKPLRDAYDAWVYQVNFISGRQGKADMLRQGDFAKLFFGTEKLGVGLSETFVPKVWPPYVEVPKNRQAIALATKSLEQRLFDTAPKPFLFWKSVKRPSESWPWDPNNSRKMALVEQQYRLDKAAADLLPEARKLALELKTVQRTEGDKSVSEKMFDLAKAHGTQVVTLNRVAKLVDNPSKTAADMPSYVDYDLPRGRIPFARADMVKDLLSLWKLQAPIKKDEKELEELSKLNEDLFWTTLASKSDNKGVFQIQVLTNKPHDVYYIATIVSARPPTTDDFMQTVLLGGMGQLGSQHSFADQIQDEYGKRLMAAMVAYLRAQGNVDVKTKAREQFDTDASSQ